MSDSLRFYESMRYLSEGRCLLVKQSFEKPICEIVRFHNNVITDSTNCICWDGNQDWGEGADSECPNLNLPECQCKLNVTDPSLGNCV